MRISEIEQSAAKNRPLPDYLTVPEICLYTALRALYESYHSKKITRDSAQVEKRKIISQCERYEAEYIAWTAAAKSYQDNIRKASTIISDIEKSHDITEIALKACECIGVMTGDTEFLKRQKAKMKEERK